MNTLNDELRCSLRAKQIWKKYKTILELEFLFIF